MTDISVVMEIPGVQTRVEAGLKQFQQRQSDQSDLKRCLALLLQVEQWKYSTGPLFDLPPYQMQLMGFAGGELLNTQPASLLEARQRGAYAAGFIGQQHVLTLDPTENLTFSPQVTLYEREGDIVRATTTRQPGLATPTMSSPATLVGLGDTWWLDERRRLHITVGGRGAFAVYLYCYEDPRWPRRAHLFSKGHQAQSDYELHHDDTGALVLVTDARGTAIWSGR